jgi:hypothetical protein
MSEEPDWDAIEQQERMEMHIDDLKEEIAKLRSLLSGLVECHQKGYSQLHVSVIGLIERSIEALK